MCRPDAVKCCGYAHGSANCRRRFPPARSPLEAQPAAAYSMNTLTDFDLFLKQELAEVATIPAGKHRHYCLAALKREALSKRRANSRFHVTEADLERQRLMERIEVELARGRGGPA
jgi:hypothetical protein